MIYLKKAAKLFIEEGNFLLAAKNLKEIAKIHESEIDFEKSLELYQTAAEY